MSTAAARPKPPRPLKLKVHAALRWVHIYLSMLSLLVVLFFSVTGLTLNHPDWLGAQPRERTLAGALPAAWLAQPEGKKLEIAERLRAQHSLRGAVDEFRIEEGEVTVAFKGAGYSADARIARATGQAEIAVVEEGTVAVLNDLHKGRNTGGVWSLALDVSAVFLTVVSLTGLGLLLYLKRLRAAALIVACVGGVALAVLIRIALR